MIPETLLVTLILGLLALTRRNSGAAIGILVASTLVWPEFLRIPIGLMEASAPRIIALLLIAKALFAGRHRVVSRCRVDHLVLLTWLWTVIATTIAEGSVSPQVIQMIGRGLDTALMYFTVRFYITSLDDLKWLARWLGFVAAVMGLLGALESVTAFSLYSAAKQYRPWDIFFISSELDQFRYGFLRAKGSTSVHIYFGISMLLVTGMLWSINKGLQLGRFVRWGILLGILGTLSSMSSGPWMGCALMFSIGLYRYKPYLIRPSIYLILLMGLLLEIASNRHFYNLIDYIVLDPQTAWYRSRLLEIAASHLSEYWLVGVGSNYPIYWGQLLDGRDAIDIVNHFLMVAIYGGLPGLFFYIASHYLAFSYVRACWKSGETGKLRFAAFYLACVLVALDISSMTVSLYGPPLILSNVLLGLVVAVGLMCRFPVADATHIVRHHLPSPSPLDDHKYLDKLNHVSRSSKSQR